MRKIVWMWAALMAVLLGCRANTDPAAVAIPSPKATRPPSPSPTTTPSTRTPKPTTATPPPTISPPSTRSSDENAPWLSNEPKFAPTVSPPLSPQAVCAALSAQGRGGLFVVYAEPAKELVWDNNPVQFRVGVCNSLPVPLVPASHFVAMVDVPYSKSGGGRTNEIANQLPPGFHEFLFSTWKPGLENHITVCVQKQVIELTIGYSDQEKSKNFHLLQWVDGTNRRIFPIKCGGTFA